MRGHERLAASLFCAAALAACGGHGSPQPAHPDGWKAQSGAALAWVAPEDPRERYTASRDPGWNGSLKDLSSQVATNIILQYKGARLVRTDPFPACPGEAGVQTFALSGFHGHEVLRAAFTQWSGPAVTIIYRRPGELPDDKAAVDAMTRAVCTPGAGPQALPPAK